MAKVAGLEGGLELGENFKLEKVSLPELTHAGGVRCERNPALAEIAAPSLAAISGELHLLTNEQLAAVRLPSLTRTCLCGGRWRRR